MGSEAHRQDSWERMGALLVGQQFLRRLGRPAGGSGGTGCSMENHSAGGLSAMWL